MNITVGQEVRDARSQRLTVMIITGSALALERGVTSRKKLRSGPVASLTVGILPMTKYTSVV